MGEIEELEKLFKKYNQRDIVGWLEDLELRVRELEKEWLEKEEPLDVMGYSSITSSSSSENSGHIKAIAWHLCLILTDNNMSLAKKKFEELIK